MTIVSNDVDYVIQQFFLNEHTEIHCQIRFKMLYIVNIGREFDIML